MTCQNFLRSHSTTSLELTRVVGLLSSTIQVVKPAKIQLRFLQQQQTNCVSKEKNEQSVSNNIKHQVKNRFNLMDRELEVLQWQNFFSIEPKSNYSNRCFPERVGSSLQWGSNIRAMVRGRENLVLELLAIKLVLFSFTKGKRVTAIHFQIDNKAALSYLSKMRITKNEHMIRLSKEIRHYLLNRNMAITAEYLPPVLNTVANRESRKKQTLQSGFFIAKFFKSFLDYKVLQQ